MPPLLEFKGVRKKKGSFSLKDITFKVEEGEYLLVEGGYRVGKTLLFKLACGLEIPDVGEVSLLGEPTDKLSENRRSQKLRRMGLLPEVPLLLYDRSVYENISTALLLREGEKSKEILEETINKFGIAHLLHKMPDELSYGEKLLVNMATIEIKNPMIILADDPLRGTDSKLEKLALDFFSQMNRTGKAVVIFSTPNRFPRKRGVRVLKLEDFRK